jgi:adenylate kinase
MNQATSRSKTHAYTHPEWPMNAGEYVPDEVTNAMVRDRLAQPDCHRGFLLDGYPRTLEQVKELDQMLADLDVRLDGVLVLTADADALVQRLRVRRPRRARVDQRKRPGRPRHRPRAHYNRPAPHAVDADTTYSPPTPR